MTLVQLKGVLDLTQFTPASRKMADALRKNRDDISQLLNITERYNRAGKLLDQTLEFINQKNKKVTLTFKEVTKAIAGGRDVATKITNNFKDLKTTVDKIDFAEKANANIAKLGLLLAKVRPITEKAFSKKEIDSYNASIVRLQAATEKLIAVDEKRARGYLLAARNAIKAGRDIAVTAKGEAGAFQAALQAAITARNKLGETQRKALTGTGTVDDKLAQAVRVQRKLELRNFISDTQKAAKSFFDLRHNTVEEDRRIHQSIRNLKLFLQQLPISAKRAGELLNKVFTGSVLDPKNPIEQRVIKQLQKLKEQLIPLGARERVKGASADIEHFLTRGRGLPSGADPAQISRLRSTFQTFEALAKKAQLTRIQLVELFKAVQSNGPLPPGIDPPIIKAINRIIYAHQQLERSSKSFLKGFLLSWESVGRLFAIQQLHRVVSEINQRIVEGVKANIELGKQISLIQTLTQEIPITTDKWAASIRRVSDLYGSDLKDTATAFYDAISNQIVRSTDDTERFITTAAKLGRVTGSSAADAGKVIAGVLNSFNFNVARANEVAATLFRTVDLGRLQLTDIADTLGRASPIAATLGISFEELASVLATLTIEGRNSETALTLFRNVAKELIKPTKEMKTLLAEWGFQSGQAAARQLGFAEIIRRFSNIIRVEGITQVSKYFDDIRGLEGIVSLTSTSFEKFNTNLRKIRDAGPIFDNANLIIMRDATQQLSKEFNRVQNFFTVTIAGSVTKGLAALNKGVGGFTNLLEQTAEQLSHNPIWNLLVGSGKTIAIAGQFTVKPLIDQLGGLTGSLIALGRGFVTYKVVTFAAANATRLFKNALLDLKTVNLASFFTRQNLFARNFKLSFNLIAAAAIAAFELIQARFSSFISTLESESKQATEQILQNIDSLLASTNVLVKRNRDTQLAIIAEIKGTILARIGDAKEAYLDYTDQIKESETLLNNFIEQQLKSKGDKFKNYVRQIKTEYDNALRAIADSQERINKLTEEHGRRQFDVLVKVTKEKQQYELIQSRVQELINSNQNNKLNEALDLTNRLLDEAADKLKTAITERRFGARIKFQQRVNELSVQANQIVEQQIANEKRLQTAEQGRADALNQLLIKENQRVVALNQAIKEASDVKFLAKRGQLDQQTAQQEIEQRIKRVFDILSQSKVPVQFSDLIDLNKLRQDVNESFSDLDAPINVQVRVKEGIAAIYKQLQTVADANVLTVNARAQLNDLGINVTTITQAETALESFFDTLKRNTEDISGAISGQRENLLKAQATLAQNQGKLIGLVGGQLGSENLIEQINNLFELVESTPSADVIGRIERLLNQVALQSESIFGTRNAIKTANEEIVSGLKSIAEIQRQLSILGQNKNIIMQQEEAARRVQNSIISTAITTQELSLQMDRTNGTFKKRIELEKQLRGILESPQPRGFASGGYVGTDMIPAMLSPGEFVMNAQSTRRFYTQLVAMNNSARSLGGQSDVNFGGININITESHSPAKTAQAVAQELRRVVRRGVSKI